MDNAVTSNFPPNSNSKTEQAVGKAKIIRWMKGFAPMAEASVTRRSKKLVLGWRSFQTSPLIAAGAGTFAGPTKSPDRFS